MYLVVDKQWRVTTAEPLDIRQCAILVHHPPSALQHMRAALDGIAIEVSETSALLSTACLKRAICLGNRRDEARRFGRLMENLHRLGIEEEMAGFVRIPVQWNQDTAAAARASPGCQQTDRPTHQALIVDTGEAFACPPDQPLLRSALASGSAAIRSGCHGGGCGVCKVRIVSGSYACGAMSRAHVDPASRQRNDVLACQVYPHSNLVIELLGGAKLRLAAARH
ncbi:2Fe-2S iron-sulfur cluster binding domain protein [compost metagenome]